MSAFCLVLAVILGSIEISCRILAGTSSQLGHLLNHWEILSRTASIDIETGALLFKPKVNFTMLNRDGEFISVQADSFGYRNAREYQGASILALGDSFTAGDGVPESERWASIVGRIMNADIYCVAAAFSGPPQQLSLLQRTIGPLHASTKTVLWMIFSGNDIGDSYRYFLQQGKKHDEISKSKWALLDDLTTRSLEHSYAVRLGLIAVRIGKLWLTRDAASVRATVAGREMDFYPAAETYVSSDEYRVGLVQLTTAIEAFADELKRQGRRLVIIYAPSKEETYSEILNKKGIGPNAIVSFDEILKTLSDRLTIEFVDLKKLFESEGRAGKQLYFSRDGHWNRLGNQLAAQAIHSYLRTDRRIPERN